MTVDGCLLQDLSTDLLHGFGDLLDHQQHHLLQVSNWGVELHVLVIKRQVHLQLRQLQVVLLIEQ